LWRVAMRAGLKGRLSMISTSRVEMAKLAAMGDDSTAR
jgi:hypothetical protein